MGKKFNMSETPSGGVPHPIIFRGEDPMVPTFYADRDVLEYPCPTIAFPIGIQDFLEYGLKSNWVMVNLIFQVNIRRC